jgi:hypothetical protein
MRSIEGPTAFNSGKPVTNNSFLHTFEQEGKFCVISEGAKNKYCIVNVMKGAIKTAKPFLSNNEPLVISKNHQVYLTCNTSDAIIHYTIDGILPSKKSPVSLFLRIKRLIKSF